MGLTLEELAAMRVPPSILSDPELLDGLQKRGHQHHGWIAEWTQTGETLLVLRQSTAEPASQTPRWAINKLLRGE